MTNDETVDVWFYSNGLKLHGNFYYPNDRRSDEKMSLILVCSGFLGLNSIHPARFARALTRQGFTCFGFDYLGLAMSEGPRGRVMLQEQVRDIENAAVFASAKEKRSVVLIGWGMGAGLILQAAYEIPSLAGLVRVNGSKGDRQVTSIKKDTDSGRSEKVAENPRWGNGPYMAGMSSNRCRRHTGEIANSAPDDNLTSFHYTSRRAPE
jgi:dienelactone hydrolase